jgi:long-chain acyl-CoA synthetase
MHYSELRAAHANLTGPGGDFEIIEADVLGQRLRCYKNAPPSVRDVWLSTTQFSDRTYLVYEDERLTYAEAHDRVNAVAAWLVDRGLQPGDRVAIAMRNYPEWMLIYWACVSCGIAAVGINAWWTPDELAYALKDSAPKALFLDRERLERVQQKPDMVAGMAVIGVRLDQEVEGITPWDAIIRQGGVMPDIQVDPDSDACIFYTSGTTGFPKGAQLTHAQ